MKIPLLLTRYLYQNKKLSLPGIGRFSLDPAAILPGEHDREPESAALGIEFKNEEVKSPDDDLIEYIRVNTGKMKSLAIADLYSYITLGMELVNIGKPFYLEGIGTLTKNKSGLFDFLPGSYSNFAHEPEVYPKQSKTEGKRTPVRDPEFESRGQSNPMRKSLVIASIVIGLAIIGWGGYKLSKKGEPLQQENSSALAPKDSEASPADSLRASTRPIADSNLATKPAVLQPVTKKKADSVQYKFVILETYDKARALKRYNQLLSYNLKINLFTRDSSFFKVFFRFPARNRDTARIKDSLNTVYGHSIIIER